MATWITTTKSSFANLDHFAHIYIAKTGGHYSVFGKSPGLSVTHDGEDRFDTIELFKGPEAECINAMIHIRALIKPSYIA